VVSKQSNTKNEGNTQVSKKRFSVTFVLDVEEDGNILSTVENHHVEDICDLVRNTFHDIDDVTMDNLNIRERA